MGVTFSSAVAAGGGGSDEVKPAKFMELMEKLNRVGRILGGDDLAGEIPRIAAIGAQSSGKSSMLTAVTGVELPTGTGTITKAPTEVHLKEKKDGKDVFEVGEKTELTKAEARKEIQVMQEAMKSEDGTVQFSEEPFRVTAHCSDGVSFFITDLPGLIADVKPELKEASEQVTRMAEKYAAQEQTVLLVVSKASSDDATDSAFALARKFDESHRRTLRVITKCDATESAEQTRERAEEMKKAAEAYAKGDLLAPHYLSVIGEDSKPRTRDDEDEFLRNKFSLDKSVLPVLGARGLELRIQELLEERVRDQLPRFNTRLDEEVAMTKDGIAKLGPKALTSDDILRQLETSFRSCVSKAHQAWTKKLELLDEERRKSKKTFMAEALEVDLDDDDADSIGGGGEGKDDDDGDEKARGDQFWKDAMEDEELVLSLPTPPVPSISCEELVCVQRAFDAQFSAFRPSFFQGEDLYSRCLDCLVSKWQSDAVEFLPPVIDGVLKVIEKKIKGHHELDGRFRRAAIQFFTKELGEIKEVLEEKIHVIIDIHRKYNPRNHYVEDKRAKYEAQINSLLESNKRLPLPMKQAQVLKITVEIRAAWHGVYKLVLEILPSLVEAHGLAPIERLLSSLSSHAQLRDSASEDPTRKTKRESLTSRLSRLLKARTELNM